MFTRDSDNSHPRSNIHGDFRTALGHISRPPPSATWFLAGSLFPIQASPGFLAGFAKVLPLTHALALMRYGLLDRHATGLHDIWGMTNATGMATLSLAVVAA